MQRDQDAPPIKSLADSSLIANLKPDGKPWQPNYKLQESNYRERLWLVCLTAKYRSVHGPHLHVRDLLLLPLVTLHLVLLKLSTRLHILVVVAGVVVELLLVHVDDVGAHVVQEVLAVAGNGRRQ